MQIGSRIKELRKSRNFSALEMSMKAQISQSYLYELESNHKSPSFETLEKICAVLHISLSEFFDSNMFELPPVNEESSLSKHYYQLSPTNRRLLDKMIEFMLESSE